MAWTSCTPPPGVAVRITIQSPLLILLPKPRVLEICRHDNAPLCCVYCVHIPTTALAPHEIHRRASNWMAIVNSLALYAVVVVFSMDDQTIWHEPSRQPQSVLYNRPLIRESILNQWLVGEQCSRIQICGILHDKLGVYEAQSGVSTIGVSPCGLGEDDDDLQCHNNDTTGGLVEYWWVLEVVELIT